MICPFMTTDPVNDPKPCIDSCALRYKDACAFNVAAQSIYHKVKTDDSNRQKSSEKA